MQYGGATWIVDRLEKLGLGERRSLPDDRRVQFVVLTPKGQRTSRSRGDAPGDEPEEPGLSLLRRGHVAAIRIATHHEPSAAAPGQGAVCFVGR